MAISSSEDGAEVEKEDEEALPADALLLLLLLTEDAPGIQASVAARIIAILVSWILPMGELASPSEMVLPIPLFKPLPSSSAILL